MLVQVNIPGNLLSPDMWQIYSYCTLVFGEPLACISICAGCCTSDCAHKKKVRWCSLTTHRIQITVIQDKIILEQAKGEDFKCCCFQKTTTTTKKPPIFFSSFILISVLLLPLAFIADLSSLLCLWVLLGSFHSAITLTLFTLVLRSGSFGEPWELCSEPDGVLEGDTDWLVGQPVSSIVNRHTDSNSQIQAAWGRQWTQAGSQRSRFSTAGCYPTESVQLSQWLVSLRK